MFWAHFRTQFGLAYWTAFGIATLAVPLWAQDVISLPTDHIEASPLSGFDSKTYSWPSQKLKPQTFQSGSFYESLNKSPGVQTQGETSGGSVSIRVRGSGGTTRNLVLLDGTPLQSQDGIGTNPLLIPQESLESLEVIKGPASLFYGADSVGGALNLKTRTYTRPTVRVSAETSNRYSLLLGSPFITTEKHFLQGSVYTEDSQNNYSYDDPVKGRSKRDNNQRTKQRYMISGKNNLSGTKISHLLMYAEEKGQSPGAVSTSPYITDFERKAYFAALGTESQVTSNSYLNLKLSQLGTQANTFESGSDSKYKVSKSYVSANYSYDVSSALSLQALTDFTYDRFSNPPSVSRTLSDERFEHAFILQYQISDADKIVTGFRYFPDQDEFVKNILISHDFKTYSTYASYSEGLRLPSFNERFNDSFGMTPNPNLDVETSHQVEVGIEKRAQKNAENFWNRTYLKAALFTIDYKNFIEYNASGSPFSYLNSGNVETQGFELSLEHDVSIYNFYLAYSFLDTEIKNQNRAVVGTPEHQLYFLTAAMLGPVVFELHNTYWSSYRADSGSSNKEDDWIVTDFVMRTKGLSDWFLKIGVMNISDTNRVFTRFGSDFYPEPGRQYFMMLERYF